MIQKLFVASISKKNVFKYMYIRHIQGLVIYAKIKTDFGRHISVFPDNFSSVRIV